MSPEAGAQEKQPTALIPPGNGTPEPGLAAPMKRAIDEDVQFISSNPVKKRRASGHGHPVNSAGPDQPPCYSAHTNIAVICQTPNTHRSVGTTAGVPCENRGASLPTMENFAFPKSFPSPYIRPSRGSEEVSPKHLPQTIAPRLLATSGCQSPPNPPLPTVALDQISCLDVKGPLNPTTMMDMTGSDPSVSPIQLTNQPLSQSGYMQLNPHTAVPFAMYSMGNLVPLPSLSHVTHCANPPGLGMSPTLSGPDGHCHNEQASVEAPEKANSKQASDPKDPQAMPATRTVDSVAVRTTAAAGSQMSAPQKPPCLICARARQKACHGQGQPQGQGLARGGRPNGPAAPLSSFWNSFPPQFGSFGQHATAMGPALVPPPLAKLGQMPTCSPMNQHSTAGGHIHNTTPPSRSPTPGMTGGLAAYVMSTQGPPHPTLTGRPPGTPPLSHPGGGGPKPSIGPPMPTSNPSSSRSGTPAPLSTPSATTPAALVATADTAPQKQPSPATPPPSSPTTLAKRKHAQNLLVDVAETVEEIFPFEEVARRHGVLQRKVVEALAAVVQLPLLKCATDKRRAGKLGSERMKEYREARKAWITRETEAGRLAKGAGGSATTGSRDDAGSEGQGKEGREAAASAPTAMQLVELLPPGELPAPLTNDAHTGPW